MSWILSALVVGVLLGFALLWGQIKSRNIDIWLPGYVKQVLKRKPAKARTVVKHVYVCIADHYEPYYANATSEQAHALVERWTEGYRAVAARHSDSSGRKPQHSYFYPVEEYDEWVLDQIRDICAEGLGDVDIHLHHDNDNAENLAITLNDFKNLLYQRHGLLREDDKGNVVYGFIHGNWALDNSRPDGRWCGVDNEIDVLIDTGCVYDMTLPSAPSDTQTSIINSIYFAREDGKAKSHEQGRLARVGQWGDERELLMIQGPLTLNWGNRKLGLIPRIENGELSHDNPPNIQRVGTWEKCGVSIEGAEDHVFIKLYTHGLQPKNLNMLFDDDGFDTLFGSLEAAYRDREGYQLHYVSGWEMYQQVEKLCAGQARGKSKIV